MKKARKIPSFKTDKQERAFWAAHSVEEFADELEELDVQIQPTRTEQIALRLHKEDLTTLQKLAEAKGIGHTTLARTVIEQWLERSRHKRSAQQHGRRHRRAG